MDYKEAMKANKTPRFDWTTLLGRPLRDWCYLQFSGGASVKYCISLVMGRLQDYYDRSLWKDRQVPNISLAKAMSSAKIGITAAHAEYTRVKKRWYGV